MGSRPVNAIPGKQGFQDTGVTRRGKTTVPTAADYAVLPDPALARGVGVTPVDASDRIARMHTTYAGSGPGSTDHRTITAYNVATAQTAVDDGDVFGTEFANVVVTLRYARGTSLDRIVIRLDHAGDRADGWTVTQDERTGIVKVTSPTLANDTNGWARAADIERHLRGPWWTRGPALHNVDASAFTERS